MAADETPNISIKTSKFILNLDECFGILDGGCNLQPIANDPRIKQQCLYPALIVFGHLGWVKTVEGQSVVSAFLEDCLPAQAGLGAFQHQKLEEDSILMARYTPFCIVISDGQISFCPGASVNSLRGRHSCYEVVGRRRLALGLKRSNCGLLNKS